MSIHEPYVISATAKQTATLIFMHGLGDSGNGWCSTFRSIAQPHIKYVFPNAPSQPVTLNLGMRMPSWFDIYGLSEDAKTDEEGVKSAAQQIRKLIDEEMRKGMPSNRIMLGGFSQGGALALYTSLTHTKAPLAGVIALSSWLVLHGELERMDFSAEALNLPILQCHGNDDVVVQYSSGKKSSELLQRLGYKFVEFRSFKNIGHGSSDEEIRVVADFINKCVAQKK